MHFAAGPDGSSSALFWHLPALTWLVFCASIPEGKIRCYEYHAQGLRGRRGSHSGAKGLQNVQPEAAHKTPLSESEPSACVYREELRPSAGPHVVADITDKRVDVHLGERTGPRAFNLSPSQASPSSVENFYASVAGTRESEYVLWTKVGATPRQALSIV